MLAKRTKDSDGYYQVKMGEIPIIGVAPTTAGADAEGADTAGMAPKAKHENIKWSDIRFCVKDKDILKGCSGSVSNGEVMAIMVCIYACTSTWMLAYVNWALIAILLMLLSTGAIWQWEIKSIECVGW